MKRRGDHPLLLDDEDDKKGAKIETDGGECDGFDFYTGEDDTVEKVEVTEKASGATLLNDVDVLNADDEEINWDEL